MEDTIKAVSTEIIRRMRVIKPRGLRGATPAPVGPLTPTPSHIM